MRNVTPGFEDWNNITVFCAKVVDGVRFMLTSDGYDIMYADADRYLCPADGKGRRHGVEVYEYVLTDEDMNVREMDEGECFMMRMFVNAMKEHIDPVWFEAAGRL